MEYWFTLCIKNNIKKEKPTPWKIYFSIKTKNNNKHKTGALKTLNKRMVKKKLIRHIVKRAIVGCKHALL